MMLGASWYGYRPLIPHVDRVDTACGYGNKGLGMRDIEEGGGSSVGWGCPEAWGQGRRSKSRVKSCS